jgi:hypothetical protein
MTETTPTKKFDALPPALVRPHLIRQAKILGILNCFSEGVLKMARGRLAFKQRDLTRAVRAVCAAGTPVKRVEINREGKIVVFVGKPEQQDDTEGNEWDKI